MKPTHMLLILAAFAAVACFSAPALAQDAAPAAPAIEDLDEPALIAIVKSDAPYTDKLKACRGLRIRGTAASVPALAAMLPDAELSHIARYALEPMQCPEAGKALRQAVAKTNGKHKAGLAISLGYRRDEKAVRVLKPLLSDADPEVAQAAAAALGRIATPAAVDALFKAGIQPAVAEGLLAAAQSFTANGKAADAVDVYEKLSAPEWPTFVRTGAFYGIVEAEPAKAPDRLVAALRGDDPLFRDTAAALVGETAGADDTRTYAEVLPSLQPDAQAALVRGLMARKDPLARPAVVESVQSAAPDVKVAAVKALSVLGTAEDVPMLAALLENPDAVLADSANFALTRMQGDGVNAAIGAATESAPAPVRARLIELLGDRRAEQALPIAIASLTHADAQVRVAALRALPPLAGPEQAPELFQALNKAADAAERTAAERVLIAIAARNGEAFLPAVLQALDKSNVESSVALLHVVARIGGGQALQTVLASLKSRKDPVKDEAVRVLSDWPTFDAVPHVLELAKAKNLNRHVLGLRGYVRLAGKTPSAEEKIAMLKEATGLARRADEKKLVIGAWTAVHATQSLDALAPALDDPEIQEEAAAAILSVAAEVAKNAAAKPAAVNALNLVIQKSASAQTKEKAQGALAAIQ